MIRNFTCLLSLLALMVVTGCATAPKGRPAMAGQLEIAELARGITALGDDVDPQEAQRAARIAYQYSHQLAQEYEITDPPLIHNMKVNNGQRPRGLCYHWAEDMEARLLQENFRTLSLHRAIANSNNPFRIEHSTAIVSRRGEGFKQGVVLDPWRNGGVLYWSPTLSDDKYKWLGRAGVLEVKRQRNLARVQ